jgi:uncharacterized protein (DUF433 family)
MQLEDYFDFEQTPHGERIRIKGTRVRIEVIIDAYLNGMCPEKISGQYPTVNLEQVFATLTGFSATRTSRPTLSRA